MPEETTEGMITFTIDVPIGRIEELKQLLEGLINQEVEFNPENQVVAFNDTLTCHSVAIGYELPGDGRGNEPLSGQDKTDPQDTRGPQEVEHRTPTGRSCSSPSRTSTGTTAR